MEPSSVPAPAPPVASTPRGLSPRRLSVVPEDPWIDPAVVAMSIQRADGEWRYCPWLVEGRDDGYRGRTA